MTSHFQRELDQLNRMVLNFSTIVTENVLFSVRSVTRRDGIMAAQVFERDFLVTQKELEIEESCLKILALYQPVATDLRFVIAILKINKELSRIGKIALNIAKKSRRLLKNPTRNIEIDFSDIGEKSVQMLQDAIGSLINQDIELAQSVIARFAELEAIMDSIRDQIYTYLENCAADARNLHAYAGIGRNLLNVGEQSVYISENITFLITNQIVRHAPADEQHLR